VLEDIAAESDPKLARMKRRSLAEEDFYFYLHEISSLRSFAIKDAAHPRVGGLWIDEPWLFERAREIQDDVEQQRKDVFYNWARFCFKTTLVTVHLTIWELLKDPLLTFLILTHQVRGVGDAMVNAIADELQKNPLLREHWPDRLCEDPRDYPLWKTGEAITIKRPHGPVEASVTVAGILNPPVSRHFGRIIGDDCVVGDTVLTPYQIDLTDERMRETTALQAEATQRRWVGTIWDADDPHMRRVKNGTFSLRRYHPAFLRDDGSADFANIAEMEAYGIAQLRSKPFFVNWAKDLGEYGAACQLQQIPVAKGRQSFDLGWVKYYEKSPAAERVGKNVYFFVDPAGDEDGSDMTTLHVRGLGADRLRYALDLWREPSLPLGEFLDLLFRLHALWQPLVVFMEEYNNTGPYQAVIREQATRSYRFPVQRLPKLHRPKPARIQLLQPLYQRGEIWYPRDGFGHGSRGDVRDTMLQFFRDEYGLWTPLKKSVRYDDALDAEAWSEQPEVRALLRFPQVYTRFQPGTVTLEDLMKPKEPQPSFWAN